MYYQYLGSCLTLSIVLSINQEIIKRSRVPHFTLPTFLLYFSVTRALTTQCPPKLANASHKLTERMKKKQFVGQINEALPTTTNTFVSVINYSS